VRQARVFDWQMELNSGRNLPLSRSFGEDQMLKNKMKAIQLSALAIAVTGAMGSTQAVAEDVDVSASVLI